MGDDAAGGRATWPAALQTAVSLMLGSAAPVCIAWGPLLTSLYDDPFLHGEGTTAQEVFDRIYPDDLRQHHWPADPHHGRCRGRSQSA